jgi:hypothetical protein
MEDQFGVRAAAAMAVAKGGSVVSNHLNAGQLRTARRRGLPAFAADGHSCSICGSIEFEGESWPSYGGTTEGFTRCCVCGMTETWADLSAVI